MSESSEWISCPRPVKTFTCCTHSRFTPEAMLTGVLYTGNNRRSENNENQNKQ